MNKVVFVFCIFILLFLPLVSSQTIAPVCIRVLRPDGSVLVAETCGNNLNSIDIKNINFGDLPPEGHKIEIRHKGSQDQMSGIGAVAACYFSDCPKGNYLGYDIYFSENCVQAEGCCGVDRVVGDVSTDQRYFCTKEDTNNDFIPDGEFIFSDARQDTFNIYTITKNDKTYDVVSNGDEWFVCNAYGGIQGTNYASIGALISQGAPLELPLSLGATSGGEYAPTTSEIGGTTTTITFTPEEPTTQIISYDNFADQFSSVTGVVGSVASTSLDGVEDKDGDGVPLPYDCDDNDASVFPNNMVIDYCGDNFNPDCSGWQPGQTFDKNQDSEVCIMLVQQPGQTGLQFDYRELASRFFCYDEDNRGAFAECAGYDMATAVNQNFSKARRQGNILTTLKEFPCAASTSTNCVYSAGFKQNPVAKQHIIPFLIRDADISINDFSPYESLEFFAYLSDDYVMNMLIVGDQVAARSEGSYTFPSGVAHKVLFNKSITDYAVNGVGLGRWMHVVIPVSEIILNSNVFALVFYADVELTKAAGGQTIMKDGVTYDNVMGVDKIFLRPKDYELMYCSGEKKTADIESMWIDDLSSDVVGGYGTPVGKFACNDIPTFGWTGTRCCGQNTDSANLEYYNDQEAGCWHGNRIYDNSRVMNVLYTVGGDIFVMPCLDEKCEYPLPAYWNQYLTNPYSDIYRMSLYDQTSEVAVIGAYPEHTASKSTSMINVQNVPLQVLYKDGKFVGCNPADYITVLKDDNGEDLVEVLNPDDFCSVKGSYFCGPSQGWSNEGVDELSATSRVNKKPAPPESNLLLNPSFESLTTGELRDYSESFSSSQSLLECTVVEGPCVDGVGLLSLTHKINSHASIYGTPGYGYSLCCSMKDGSDLKTYTGATVLSLLYDSNSHVSISGGGREIKLGSDNHDIGCHYGNCGIMEECLGSVISDTNSHFLACGKGEKNICCGVGVGVGSEEVV